MPPIIYIEGSTYTNIRIEVVILDIELIFIYAHIFIIVSGKPISQLKLKLH